MPLSALSEFLDRAALLLLLLLISMILFVPSARIILTLPVLFSAIFMGLFPLASLLRFIPARVIFAETPSLTQISLLICSSGSIFFIVMPLYERIVRTFVVES